MALIEGIGDEVVVFVAALALLVLITMAWLSTHVADRPNVDVVVIDQNRIMQLLNRVRTATTDTLNQTPIGYIVRGGGADGQNRDASSSTLPEAGAEPTATGGGDEGGEEGVSLVYARVVPDHTVNCPHRQQQQQQQQEQQQDGQADSSALSSVPSAPSNESQQPAPAVVMSDASSEPTASAPDASEPTSVDTAEGLRNRRVAFFQTNRSLVDDSQAAAPTLEQSPQPQETVCDQPTISTPSNNQSETTTQSTSPAADQSDGGNLSGNQSNAGDSERLDGHIRIRLKYLDDRQRLVQARPGHTIGQFKQHHFEGEVGAHTTVRLIYNGQELQSSRTLESYNVEDSSVIHCLFSRTEPAGPEHTVIQATFDMGRLIFPLFGLILGIIWYCRFVYRSYFNAMTTVSLIGITFLYTVALMAALRTRGGRHTHAHAE